MESMQDTRFRFLCILASLVVLLSSCSKSLKKENLPQQQPFPTGSPMSDSISFRFAIYLPPGSAKGSLAVLRHEVTDFPDVKMVADFPKEPKDPVVSAVIQEHVHTEYAPPDLNALKYFGRGLSQAQAAALQTAKEALILDFGHSKQTVWSSLRTANVLVERVARKTGGLIWDAETREVFTPDAWHNIRVESWTGGLPNISTQTTIHEYENGEYARAITLGMNKAGLPDVVVEDIAWSSNNQVGNFINIFCQSVSEGATLGGSGVFKLDLRSIKNPKVRDADVKGNGTGLACITLKQGRRDEGDPDNRLIELAPDRYPGPDVHAKQDQMLGSFFGWEDSINYVKHNDELLAASRLAKSKLPALREAFTGGLQPGEFIQVKAPFATPDGGTEWMWVEITKWRGSKIEGLLQNEPFQISNLHSGQKVEVQQEDVFDYIRTYADKHEEGNTTGEIIKKQQDEGKLLHVGQPSGKPTVPDCGS